MKPDQIVNGMKSALSCDVAMFKKGTKCVVGGLSKSTGLVLITFPNGKQFNCKPEQLIGVL